jgi:hypothetical protein
MIYYSVFICHLSMIFNKITQTDFIINTEKRSWYTKAGSVPWLLEQAFDASEAVLPAALLCRLALHVAGLEINL